MKKILYILLLIGFVSEAQVKAFPTAYGAGQYTVGGRGGTVYYVTETTDDASGTVVGSYSHALKQTHARTILFKVNHVRLTSDIHLSGSAYDNITLAGQTAPGGSVTITGGRHYITAVNQMIWRYVRAVNGVVYVGRDDDGNGPYSLIKAYCNEITMTGDFTDNVADDLTGYSGSNTTIQSYVASGDAFSSYTGEDVIAIYNADHVIFDHCTGSLGGDECFDISTRVYAGYPETTQNVTVQHCLFTESKTGLILGASGLVPEHAGTFTYHHNAAINISHRTPNTSSKSRYDVYNNINYNWIFRTVRLENGGNMNHVNNVYKPGVNSQGGLDNIMHKVSMSETHIQQIYEDGTQIIPTEKPDETTDGWQWWSQFYTTNPLFTENDPVPTDRRVLTPHTYINDTNIEPTDDVWDSVINDVGANAYLDENGNKITSIHPDDLVHINDAINGTNSITSEFPSGFKIFRNSGWWNVTQIAAGTAYTDSDNDGMPDAWETTTFGDLTRDGTGDLDADGYTDLEEFLNLVEGAPAPTGNISYPLTTSQKSSGKRAIKKKIIKI